MPSWISESFPKFVWKFVTNERNKCINWKKYSVINFGVNEQKGDPLLKTLCTSHFISPARGKNTLDKISKSQGKKLENRISFCSDSSISSFFL